jgi:hypothetical protein
MPNYAYHNVGLFVCRRYANKLIELCAIDPVAVACVADVCDEKHRE